MAGRAALGKGGFPKPRIKKGGETMLHNVILPLWVKTEGEEKERNY